MLLEDSVKQPEDQSIPGELKSPLRMSTASGNICDMMVYLMERVCAIGAIVQ